MEGIKTTAPQQKIDLLYRQKDVVGIDIGSTSIKAVQLKRSRKLVRLCGYGDTNTPPGIIVDGVITDPEKMAEEIKKLLAEIKMGHITAKRAATSLPETKIFTRIIKVPEMSKKEISEAAVWELDQYVPTPTNELYFDWHIVNTLPVKGKGTQYEVMIVAAPKKIVDSYIETFRLVGLELFSVEPSLAAISRSIVSEKKGAPGAIIIIDIGGDASNIAVYEKGLRVTGSIPVGGGSLAPPFVASSNKVGGVAGKSTAPAKKAMADISGNVSSIADEVKKVIKYYADLNDKNSKISKILLCGGCASITGISEEFSKILSIPTEVGNPWTNISVYPLKPISKTEVARFTNAVGLALKGVNDD